MTDFPDLKLKVIPQIPGKVGPMGPTGLPGRDGDTVWSYASTLSLIGSNVPPVNMYVHVAGYTAAGDGGEALYQRVASVTGGCYGVQSADGAWWQLAELDVRPQMMGADSTGTVDAHAQIQMAIDHVQAIGTGTVQLRGFFVLSAPLNVLKGVRIQGATRAFTTFYPANGINVFNINTADAVIFEGFAIIYADPGTSSAMTISAATANYNSIFRDLFINSCYIGLDFLRAAGFTVENCQIFCQRADIRIANTHVIDEGDSLIVNSFLAGVKGSTIGISWSGSGGLKTANNKIINHFWGVSINMTNTPDDGAHPISTAGLVFTGNNIEGCSNAAFDFRRQGSLGNLYSISINGGHCAGCPIFVSVTVDASGVWLHGLVVNGVSWSGQGTGSDVFALINSTLGFSVTGNCLRAISGATTKIITGASADSGVVGPNIGVGTFAASSIASTNTTQIAPT